MTTALAEPAPSHRSAPVAGDAPPDAEDAVERAVAELLEARRRWAKVDDEARAALLDACRDSYAAVARAVVASGLGMKAVDARAPEAGEEWAFVLGVLKLFRVYASSLRDVARTGRPRVPSAWSAQRGRVVVKTAPIDLAERMALAGGTGEVWCRAGISLDEARARQGARWRARAEVPPLMALLGAGNVPLLVPGDVLHGIFLEGHVVVLKLNPVNEALAPMWREAFAPLIEAGCLRVVTGDASVGARLCTHPAVDAVHMTGSHHTYEAVAFGGGGAGGVAEAKARGVPVNARPITAELGNVTPVIVVPGPWTAQELRYHALQLGSQHGLNAAHNCLTPRLLVQARSWPQRAAFLDELRRFFAALPLRRAYYPGSASRHGRFLDAHPGAECIGSVEADRLPWTLVTGLDSAADDEVCFREESFCAVLAEATVEATDVPTFLARAVEFVNTRVWGNLTATLLVHPATLKDAASARAVDDAVAALRYGAVCVNIFGSFVYATPTLPWGAFPGNTPADIQSGVGFVNNVLDVPDPEKAVLRAPFTVGRTPPLNLLWKPTARLLEEAAWLEHRFTLGGVARALGAAIAG